VNLNLKNLKTKLYHNLIPKVIYKKPGELPYKLLQQLEHIYQQKYYHLGNLDAFAEGLMVFIPAKLRFLEKPLKKLPKKYTLHLLVGFTTDTYDLLGLVKKYNYKKAYTYKGLKSLIYLNLQSLQSMRWQIPPKVSYKNLSKPYLLKLFRESGTKKLPNLKPTIAYIKYFKITGAYYIKKDFLVNYILNNAKKINKDYRQDKIINRYLYLKSANRLSNEFLIVKIDLEVSSGFYVRSLVRDLSKSLKIPFVSYKIVRKSLGIWSV